MRTILRWSTVISITMIFSLMILEVGVLAKKKRKHRNSQTTVAKQTQRAPLIVPLIVQTSLAEVSTNQDINSSGLKSAIKPLAKFRTRVKGILRKEGLQDYLILLSIQQTCKYRGISFLDFLKSREKSFSSFEKA